ncbi:hypothetical protein BOW53_08145 [Solemya pervernicosa gill symbiont]|uniref:Cytochrome c domain-containing protein n=2 Tax=Gammaproteobacteria incertae sedis TaxID=118884 RepID=A0A1T2L5K2_9GAMM|nr:c-type cytochrome [Candidatus Reidiella endopervernicosa]OOZ40334.1 hypothetical protein BOW53_08145 [Solemya pervernicosa gill symbiont]QKQ24859.1 cytochrome c5 family protein [Candidatus Reidiella endopervernicosa]
MKKAVAFAIAGALMAMGSSAQAERDGKGVYDTKCFVCHAAGVAGAPKFADKAAWAPRIATGMDALNAVSKNGKGAMPPKGTCMDCTDGELSAAVAYMVDAAK